MCIRDSDYFDAVNEKNYDKAFTYVINQTKTNPVEKQKWMESMKSAQKVVVGSLGAVSYTHLDVYKRQGLIRFCPCFIRIVFKER